MADDRAVTIIDRWGPVLRALSGVDDVVLSVCSECQFEDRNGHAPGCVGDTGSPACRHSLVNIDGSLACVHCGKRDGTP